MIDSLLQLAEATETATNTLGGLINELSPGDRAPAVVMTIVAGMVLVMVVAAIVSKTACRIHKARLEDTLKRELIDRGFSADEIAKIVETSALPGPRVGIGRAGVKGN
jgi:hypothetical protein